MDVSVQDYSTAAAGEPRAVGGFTTSHIRSYLLRPPSVQKIEPSPLQRRIELLFGLALLAAALSSVALGVFFIRDRSSGAARLGAALIASGCASALLEVWLQPYVARLG